MSIRKIFNSFLPFNGQIIAELACNHEGESSPCGM